MYETYPSMSMYDSDIFESEDDYEDFDDDSDESLGDELDEFDEGYDLDELLDDFDDDADVRDVFRGLLREDYENAGPDDLDEALSSIFESLTPAESFGLDSVLGGLKKSAKVLGKGATQAMVDPTVAQFVRGAAPLAGGALGGPAGALLATSLASQLGPSAPGTSSATTPGVKATVAPPPSAKPVGPGGSVDAFRALIASQLGAAPQALAQAALGTLGRKTVDGIPVPQILDMFHTMLGQATEDADQLFFDAEDSEADSIDGEAALDPLSPADRAQATYSALLAEANEQLAEWSEWR